MNGTFRNVLCPVYFDEASTAAVDYARLFAGQDDGMVHLLHVVPTDEFHLHSRIYRPEEAGGADARWAERVARERLEEIARERFGGLRCQTVTRVSGDAAAAILEAARAVGADLLVMATHARTGLARLLRGSVAERAVREAPCPVFTTRGAQPPAAAPRKILVPIDIGYEPGPALALAARMAQRSDGTVYLLHVVPTEEIYLLRDVYRPDEGGGTANVVWAEKVAREKLGEIARMRLAGVRSEAVVHVGDDPARTIMEVEQDLGAQLLVMATHGMTGILRLIVGSLTERLVRESLCPVLSMRE